MYDRSKLESLPLSVQKEKAFNKVLRCVSASEQSSAKLRKKLESQGYCVEAVDDALDRSLDLGIVDDTRYAECLVRSTVLSGKGLRAVRSEIESLGVDINALDSYQEYLEMGEEAEVERAVSYLQTHPTRSKDPYQSCYRKLMAKGFEGDVIPRAVKRYLATRDPMDP